MDKLSDEGKTLVIDRLAKGWVYSAIVSELLLVTGEEISDSSVARFNSSHQAQERIREARMMRIGEEVRQSRGEAQATITAIKEGDVKAEEIGLAMFQQAMFENRLALQSANPIAVSREERQRQALDLKRSEQELKRWELTLKERAQELNEKRFEAQDAKLRAIEEKAAEAKKRVALNPEEAAKQIDEIYGLTQN